MPREIKFRGLMRIESTGTQEWVYYTPGTKPMLVGATWLVQDEESTSLKDKNGKEIYEGDILQAAFRATATGEGVRLWPQQVYWDTESASFRLKPSVCGPMALAEDAHFAIIGNIHESSQLLERIDQ